MNKKILSVVGARPQFVKAAAVSRAIATTGGALREVMVHTGQHFDANMSDVFFTEMEIAAPAYNLEIAGGGHGAMTGRMLEAIEQVMVDERPDWVLVYGDTNSTLAGALAAAKLHIPVAHVEAGLRSFNMRMPEEINRILSDRVSRLLLCPTRAAVANLASEGLVDGVHNVGDVMYDVALYFGDRARDGSGILKRLDLEEKNFVLATCHRAENTDDPARLGEIVSALSELGRKRAVVLPLHPRTRKLLGEQGLERLASVRTTEPLGFLDMVALERAASAIITDSGGVQKEAFFFGVPCVTMRDETEWVETVELGMNTLAGASAERIVDVVEKVVADPIARPLASPYGDGRSAEAIVSLVAGIDHK